MGHLAVAKASCERLFPLFLEGGEINRTQQENSLPGHLILLLGVLFLAQVYFKTWGGFAVPGLTWGEGLGIPSLRYAPWLL